MWWFLLACGRDLGFGDLGCLELPSETDEAPVSVEGEVVDVGPGECTWNLTVRDAEGGAWTAGFTVLDDDRADRTPEPDLAVGDAVRLAWVDERGIWPVRRLVVERGGALVVSAGVNGVEAEDGGGVGVSIVREVDNAFRHLNPRCAVASHPLAFTAEDGATVTVDPYGVDSLAAPDGGSFSVYALAAEGAADPEDDCHLADYVDPIEWAVARDPSE